MKICSCWRVKFGFKIRSKKDVITFFDDILIDGGEYAVPITRTYMLWVEKHDGLVTVSDKQGNLSDIFNPLFQFGYSEGIDMIYRYRKYVNAKFFSDCN